MLVIDIQADAVGHDLNRGVANYIRPQPQPVNSDGHPVRDLDEEVQASTELAGGSEGMIDEEAIERFGRDLDESLNEAGFAAQALDEDEETNAAAPL